MTNSHKSVHSHKNIALQYYKLCSYTYGVLLVTWSLGDRDDLLIGIWPDLVYTMVIFCKNAVALHGTLLKKQFLFPVQGPVSAGSLGVHIW